jgi:excisionase family DNA binding protein
VTKFSNDLGASHSRAATRCHDGNGRRRLDTSDPPPSPTNPLLDIDAVAARLGVSSKTVRRHIDRGELAVHRIGRLLRVSEEDLASFVAARRQIQSKETM